MAPLLSFIRHLWKGISTIDNQISACHIARSVGGAEHICLAKMAVNWETFPMENRGERVDSPL